MIGSFLSLATWWIFYNLSKPKTTTGGYMSKATSAATLKEIQIEFANPAHERLFRQILCSVKTDAKILYGEDAIRLAMRPRNLQNFRENCDGRGLRDCKAAQAIIENLHTYPHHLLIIRHDYELD
jgi:hypothetical protein